MLETIYRFNPMITNVGIVALEKNQINHHIYSRPIAIFGIYYYSYYYIYYSL